MRRARVSLDVTLKLCVVVPRSPDATGGGSQAQLDAAAPHGFASDERGYVQMQASLVEHMFDQQVVASMQARRVPVVVPSSRAAHTRARGGCCWSETSMQLN